MKPNEIDLIPGDFRKQRALQRLSINFLLVCTGVLCLIAIAWVTLAYISQRDTAQFMRLEQEQKTLLQSQSITEELRQQKRLTEQQINALAQLRGHDQVALFLNALDAAYQSGIWLDTLHFMRRPASTPADKSAGSNPVLDLSQRAEIVGHATSHTALAGFMRGLGAQPGLTGLKLVSTGTRSATPVPVVDFNLTLQVIEKKPVQP